MIILAEIKPGIDPQTTDLIVRLDIPGDLDEYWLKDENETISQTLWSGAIAGNHWEMDGETLQINTTGATSECWELDGTVLQLTL